MGSASELDYHLLLSRDLGFMNGDDFTRSNSWADGGAEDAYFVLAKC